MSQPSQGNQYGKPLIHDMDLDNILQRLKLADFNRNFADFNLHSKLSFFIILDLLIKVPME